MSHSLLFYANLLESSRHFFPLQHWHELNRTFNMMTDLYLKNVNHSLLLTDDENYSVLKQNDREIFLLDKHNHLRKQLKLFDLLISVYLFDNENNFEEDKETFALALRKRIKNKSNSLNKRIWSKKFLDTLKEWRSKTKVRKSDFFSECLPPLKKVLVKLEASSQSQSLPEPLYRKTINKVFPLYKKSNYRGIEFLRTHKPIGYLKGCLEADCNKPLVLATSHLEKLMWEISLKLGWSQYFVPTEISLIKYEDGNLIGSIQPNISNATLGDVISNLGENINKNSEYISFSSGAKAFAISILLGMFDAHSANMFINVKKKGILFFDNSRSLPHSNGIICRNKSFYLSYRSHFTLLPLMYEKIDEKQIFELNEMAIHFLSNLGVIRDEIEETKKHFEFPENWLNTDDIIEAATMRALAFIEALKESELLIEVLFRTDPIYCLFFILKILNEISLQKKGAYFSSDNDFENPNHYFGELSFLLKKLDENVSKVEETLNSAIRQGIDLENVEIMSRKFKNFSTLMTYIDDYSELLASSQPKLTEEQEIFYEKFFKKIIAGAKIDEKDPELKERPS